MHEPVTTTSIEALGFAAAAALCAMLLVMHWRVSTHVARGYAWLWFTGFIYAIAAFAASCISLMGPRASTELLNAAESLAWSSTCFSPLIFTGLVEPYVRSVCVQRAVRGIAYAATILLLGRFALVAHGTNFDVGESAFPAHSFYVSLSFALVCVTLAFVNRRARSDDWQRRDVRWFTPVASGLAIIQLLATMASIHDFESGTTRSILAAISTLWVLPWTIVLAFFFAQTRFADIALKRTIMLMLSILIAAGVTWSLPVPPDSAAFTLATLTIAATMLATPAIYRGLHWCIDRVLLRRPRYRLIERAFEDSVRRIETPAELIAEAIRSISETLQVNVRALPRNCPRSEKNAPLATMPLNEHGHLIIEDRIGARALMQEEFYFLERVAAQTRQRLESLQLEADRRELRVNEERLQRSVTEAELKALRAQVDPHFLFNTLNAIADLTSSNPEQAEAMIERLAECFRYALSRHERTMSTLQEELQFLERYLDIEQVRFGSRLRVELKSESALSQMRIPSLILQPLVENAVRHGLASKPGGGCVSVSASQVGEYLQLQVSDDGVGMQTQEQQSKGVGLRNVRERLQLLYRERAQMTISPGALGCGTSITLLVPAT